MTRFISIVVPFHNNRKQIGSCCESLLQQTFRKDSYEVIFVDNNSTDGSAGIVAAYPSIQLLQQHAPGSYAARNLGIRAARGQIIAFTDADCIAAPDWLARIETALSNQDVAVVLGAYSGRLAQFPARALSAYENSKNRYIFANRDRSLFYGYTNNMAVKRCVFQKYGYFPEISRGGDAILVRIIVNQGQSGEAAIRYDPAMFVDHLEFNRVSEYYRKVFIHSRSVRTLHGGDVMRPLTNLERHQVFRDMVRVERYSPIQAAVVYVMIAIGMLFWIAGWVMPLSQTLGPPQRRN